MARRGATTAASVGLSVIIGALLIVPDLTPPPDPEVMEIRPASPPEVTPTNPARHPRIVLPPPPVPAPAPGPEVAVVMVAEPKPIQQAEPRVSPLAPTPEPEKAKAIPTPLTPTPTPATTPTIELVAAPDPVQPALPVTAIEPAPTPEPLEPAPVVVEATALADGRPLLRILEHGAGPSIEIAWPNATSERERLFELFRSCFGMRVAVMDGQGNVFRDDGQPGQRWDIDLDRYSGFVRQPMGNLTAAEAALVRAAQSRHRGIGANNPVRIFPRNADALLLGGLRQIVGTGTYETVETIRAVYRLEGGQVIVDSIVADGRAVAGGIPLHAASGC